MTRCASCGRPFAGQRSTARYCGDSCRKRAHRALGELERRAEQSRLELVARLDDARFAVQRAGLFAGGELRAELVDIEQRLIGLGVTARAAPAVSR